jgi:hypothetical protein
MTWRFSAIGFDHGALHVSKVAFGTRQLLFASLSPMLVNGGCKFVEFDGCIK